jgi:hypothetical protein
MLKIVIQISAMKLKSRLDLSEVFGFHVTVHRSVWKETK